LSWVDTKITFSKKLSIYRNAVVHTVRALARSIAHAD